MAQVERTPETAGLEPRDLRLEMTESMLMEDVSSSTTAFARPRAGGVRIEIDGFGTGYSSFYHLRRFATDGLKIDKSCVDKLGSDEESVAIVEAVITPTRTLLGYGRPVEAAADEILETGFSGR